MVKQICALTLTVAAIAGGHVAAALDRTRLYPHSWYLAFDGLYFLLAGQLVLIAFFLVRKEQAIWRSALSRACMAVASLCLFVATLDLGIMAFCCDTSGLGGNQCFTHNNWYKRFARSNQLGYWERDLAPFLEPPKPGRELVIAAVGDSWTWGQGVHGKQYRFTNVLEADLQAKPSAPMAVLNFGRAGADTTEELTMLDDVAKVKPDIVLLCYLANDIDHYAKKSPLVVEVSACERWLILLSPTYNFLYWRVIAPQTDWTSRAVNEFGDGYFQAVCRAYRDPEMMEMHVKDLDALIARVRAIKATPVLVILPFPSMWQDSTATDSTGGKRELRDHVYAAIAKRAQEIGVPVIEAQGIEDEMTIREFSLTPMDAHPNEKVHRRIAQIIGSELSKQNLLEPK